MAGGGGVFRIASGEFLTAFTFLCGECDALTAELWAIAHGLQRAEEIGIAKLEIEMDCLSAVELLSNRSPTAHRNYHLLRDCKEAISKFPGEVTLKWIPRSANKAADAIANYALLLNSEFEILYDPPICNQHFISCDSHPMDDLDTSC